jgi:replicative DNA helicase
MSVNAPERLPPQSRDAERAVLGSMLKDNTVIGDLIQLLRADYFYADAHQKIYQAIIALYDKGHPVDLVVLAEELIQRGQLEDVGSAPYLAELWDAVATAANAEHYAKIVRDRALVRNLIHAGTEILRDAYDQVQPADEMLESAERRILEIAQIGISGQTHTLHDAITEAYDRIDRRSSSEHKTSMSGLPTGFAALDEITAGLQNSELIVVAARPSVGKCLTSDSEIVLADGSVATIEELCRRRSARLLTLRDDWKLDWTEPSAYVDDGVKPVYRVTTRLGRQVETTACHPFRTLPGWRPLSELKVGDRIAVPRRIDVFGTATMRECELKLLAYLLGDGCLTDISPEFTNSNPRLQQDFAEAATSFGPVQVRRDERPDRTTTLYVRGNLDYIRRNRVEFGVLFQKVFARKERTKTALGLAVGVTHSSVTNWLRGTTSPCPEVFSRLCQVLEVQPEDLGPDGRAPLSGNGKNLLTVWLRELGLWGKGAHKKFIPPVVFRLTRPLLALFLNRLFATDGWASVSPHGGVQVGYCTVSEKLARQTQHLLLRFGVVAGLRRKKVHYRGEARGAWQLEITHRDSLRRFAEEIGIFGKEEALGAVLAALEKRGEKAFRDTVPDEVWGLLEASKREESWSKLACRAGYEVATNLHVGKRGLSRKRLLRFAEALGSSPLQELATSDVYWDEIVAIEPVGNKQVYDLTIPDTHNFVANDICVHNTAYALALVRNIIVNEHQPVFFVSLEQSRIELAERLLCAHSRVDSHKLRTGNLSAEDMQKLIDAGGELRNAKLFIDDTPGQGMLRIAANARRLLLREKIKLVVIDYLQLIEPENRRDPRQEQVAQISRRLKGLARELELPVIALAQVNRAAEDRQDHRPRLSDLRESGSIEQDADTVMLLHRPERYEPGQHEGVVEVIIGKQRNGPTGEVTLSYIKQYLRFEDFQVAAPFQP